MSPDALLEELAAAARAEGSFRLRRDQHGFRISILPNRSPRIDGANDTPLARDATHAALQAGAVAHVALGDGAAALLVSDRPLLLRLADGAPHPGRGAPPSPSILRCVQDAAPAPGPGARLLISTHLSAHDRAAEAARLQNLLPPSPACTVHRLALGACALWTTVGAHDVLLLKSRATQEATLFLWPRETPDGTP